MSIIPRLQSLIFRWTSADAMQLFLCAFVVTFPLSTTLKITQEAKRRKLKEDVNKLIKDIEHLSEESYQGIGPSLYC